MSQTNKVEDLTLEQLRDEVWLWRTEATARLFFTMGEVEASSPRSRVGHDARRRLNAEVETLSDALAGNYHPSCFVCGFSIRPGDAVLTDVNEGEMHAECPQHEGGPQAAAPGDKIYMDPESIVIDEDHPEGGDPALKPDHLVAFAAGRLYSDEQIVAKIEAARLLLTGVR